MRKLILLSLICSFVIVLIGCENKLKKEEVVDKINIQKEEIKKTSITLSFVGDVTLGNYVGQSFGDSFDEEYQIRGKDSTYFFKNVKNIFAEDDLTIANLEGPLTTSSQYAKKKFAFKGKPEYVDILKEGNVDVVTLANNHSNDYFKQGMMDTKNVLNNAHIEHFGYGKSSIIDAKGVKLGFLGYAFPQTFNDNMKKSINQLKDKTDIIIVYFHWGIERDKSPMAMQRSIAKQCIDEGVDLVIGSHPHVLQGIEKYKGKTIVYSLGNFCFGGNKNPSDKDTMIYQHTFHLENKTVVSQKSNIIPCMISSNKSRNNYQPQVADDQDAKRVLKKVSLIEG